MADESGASDEAQSKEENPKSIEGADSTKPAYFVPRRESKEETGGDSERTSPSQLPPELKNAADMTKGVAKTLLEKDEPQPSQTDSAANLPPELKKAAEATKGVAKTLLEQDESQSSQTGPTANPKAAFFIPRASAASQTAGGEEAAQLSQLPPKLQAAAEMTKKVAKTMLDHGAVKDVVKRSFAEQEAKLSEELKNRPVEPPKPFVPIEKFRMATVCGMKWDAMKGTDRVRFCEKCHLQVYNFTKIEQPEVEEIIFQKEAKKNVVLYKRKDGTFLTQDCPVAVGKRRTLIISGVAAILLAAGCFLVLKSLPPPPVAKVEPSAKESPAASTIPQQSSDGWVESTDQPTSSPKAGAPARNSVLPNQNPGGGMYPAPAAGTQAPVPVTPAPGQIAPGAQNGEAVPGAMPVPQTLTPPASSSSPAQTVPPAQQAPPAQQSLPAGQAPSSEQSSNQPASSQPTQQPGVWQRSGK